MTTTTKQFVLCRIWFLTGFCPPPSFASIQGPVIHLKLYVVTPAATAASAQLPVASYGAFTSFSFPVVCFNQIWALCRPPEGPIKPCMRMLLEASRAAPQDLPPDMDFFQVSTSLINHSSVPLRAIARIFLLQ